MFICCLQGLPLRSVFRANCFTINHICIRRSLSIQHKAISYVRLYYAKSSSLLGLERYGLKIFGEQIIIFIQIKRESKCVLIKNVSCLKHILVSYKYRKKIYLKISASKSCVLLPSVSVNVMLLPFSHYSLPGFGWEVYRVSTKLEIDNCNEANKVKFLKSIIFSNFDHIWSYRDRWQRHEVVFMKEMKSMHLSE